MSWVESLIVKHSITKFYVGNQGNFVRMAKSVLQTLQKKISFIIYYIVLAYFPCQKEAVDDAETIYRAQTLCHFSPEPMDVATGRLCGGLHPPTPGAAQRNFLLRQSGRESR